MATRRGNGLSEADAWVEKYARLGYLVKGIVYITVGLLALQVALGIGGLTTGASGALVSIARQPFGQALLGVVAVGLVGHALWRFVQAAFDVERKGTSPKALLKRFGYLVSGLAYGGLALEAWRLLLGVGSGSNGQSQELWTARFLSFPFGRWLVGAGALAVLGLALNAGIVAVRQLYRKKLKTEKMSSTAVKIADVAAIAGLIGRGAVLAAIGILLFRAALFFNPQEAGSSGEALTALVQAPQGRWLLGGVAAGLIAYGVFAMVQARYRKVDL